MCGQERLWAGKREFIFQMIKFEYTMTVNLNGLGESDHSIVFDDIEQLEMEVYKRKYLEEYRRWDMGGNEVIHKCLVYG